MNVNPQELINELPENLKSFVDTQNPREKRMLAARAAIPLVPKDLVRVLLVLVFDQDEEIRKEAGSSLGDIPENIMTDIISDKSTHPALLDYVAREFGKEKYNQAILLNTSTSDSTFVYLARHETSNTNLEIIANNKKRILSNDGIVEALSNNPAVSRSTLDEVLSFLNLYLQKDVTGAENLPGDEEKDRGAESSEDVPADRDEPEDYGESFFDNYEIEQQFLEENDDDPEDVIKESTYSILQNMKMGEKIKLALQGNMEARRILIKDNNKIVSNAVLKNPRLTDMEVILICQSKVVDDEILRKISETRKWMRLYQVKLSLVNNPKTPVHISMNLLRHLREHDLRRLMVDKNLPGTITNAARNIMRGKR